MTELLLNRRDLAARVQELRRAGVSELVRCDLHADALTGSYGLQAQIVDNTGLYVRDDTPEAEPRYRARFTFDPNSINIGYGGMHDIFVGRSGTIDVFRVQVTRLYGSYQLRTQARFDSATYTTTAWVAISDAAHLIELDWQAAMSVGANNGYLAWWLDGVSQSPLANLDNDTRRVNEVRLGPSNGIDTYTRGTEYFDDFESRRSTYIGPVVPASMSSEIHKSYYRAGATLVAVRVQGDPTATNNGLFYLHSDHLGSTSLTTCGTATTEGGCGGVEFGGVVTRQLYDAWGNVRVRGNLPTDIGYTGQRENSDIKLVQMGARWYDPALGRWLSPDTIVPDPTNPQSLNRFGYVNNNPLKYIDPSGHEGCTPDNLSGCTESDLVEWMRSGLFFENLDSWLRGFAGHFMDLLSKSETGNLLLQGLGFPLDGSGIRFSGVQGGVATGSMASGVPEVILDVATFVNRLGMAVGFLPRQTAFDNQVNFDSLANLTAYYAGIVGHELFHMAIGDRSDAEPGGYRNLGDYTSDGKNGIAYVVEAKIVNEIVYGGNRANYLKDNNDLWVDWNYGQARPLSKEQRDFLGAIPSAVLYFRMNPIDVISAALIH